MLFGDRGHGTKGDSHGGQGGLEVMLKKFLFSLFIFGLMSTAQADDLPMPGFYTI